MPEWEPLVRSYLRQIHSPLLNDRDFVKEISGHLEESYGALEKPSLNEKEAIENPLGTLREWEAFSSDVLKVRCGNKGWTFSVRTIWLPTLITLTLSGELLHLFQLTFERGGAMGQSLILSWFLPYLAWLVTLPVFGVVAAFISKLSGGTTRSQLIANVVPSVAMLIVWGAIVGIGVFRDQNSILADHWATAFFSGALTWSIVPAIFQLSGNYILGWTARRSKEVD